MKINIEKIILGTLFITALNFIVLISRDSSAGSRIILTDRSSKEADEDLKRTICKRGMESILRKEASEDYVNPDLIKNLELVDYEGVGEVYISSSYVKMTGNLICRYVLTEKDKNRAFSVELDRGEDYSFLYSVYNIKEVKK